MMKNTIFYRYKHIILSLIIAILFSLLPYLKYFHQIKEQYYFNADSQIFTWVFHKDSDPELFNNDPIYEYIRSGVILPSFGKVYSTFTKQNINPLLLSNIFSFILLLILTISVWYIGYAYFGPWFGALFAVSYLSAFAPLSYIWGAHNHGFGIALGICAIAFFSTRNSRTQWIGIGICIITTFIYPVILIMTFTFLGLKFLYLFGKYGFKANNIENLFVFLLLHLILFAITHLIVGSNPYGKMLTKDMALNSPHWVGERPRYGMYPINRSWAHDFLFEGIFNGAPGPVISLLYGLKSTIGIKKSILLITACASLTVFYIVFLFVRKKTILHSLFHYIKIYAKKAPELFLMPIAAITLYTLAGFFAFNLYVPSRYITYLFIFSIHFIFVAVLYSLFDILKEKRINFNAILGIVFLMFFGHQLFLRTPLQLGMTRTLTDKEMKLLEFIAKEPKDSMIFTNLRISQSIPLISKRSVLWNSEVYHIFHLDYAQMLDDRARAALTYLSSGDTKKLKKYSVTHIIIDKSKAAPHINIDCSFLFSPVYDECMKSGLEYNFVYDNVIYDDGLFVVMKIE